MPAVGGGGIKSLVLSQTVIKEAPSQSAAPLAGDESQATGEVPPSGDVESGADGGRPAEA